MDDEAPIIGPPQSIVNKAIFADLLSAQIKVSILFILSTMTLTLYQSSNLVACFVKLQVPPEVWSRHKESIGDGSVRMLRVLPAEISEKRRVSQHPAPQRVCTQLFQGIAYCVAPRILHRREAWIPSSHCVVAR